MTELFSLPSSMSVIDRNFSLHRYPGGSSNSTCNKTSLIIRSRRCGFYLGAALDAIEGTSDSILISGVSIVGLGIRFVLPKKSSFPKGLGLKSSSLITG